MNQVTNKLLSNISHEELQARHNQLRRAYMDLHAANQELNRGEAGCVSAGRQAYDATDDLAFSDRGQLETRQKRGERRRREPGAR